MLKGGPLKLNAVHRTHGHTQLTARAFGLDDRVHALVSAKYGIGWTSLKAQRAANAPVFIDECHSPGRLQAKLGIESGGAET